MSGCKKIRHIQRNEKEQKKRRKKKRSKNTLSHKLSNNNLHLTAKVDASRKYFIMRWWISVLIRSHNFIYTKFQPLNLSTQ